MKIKNIIRKTVTLLYALTAFLAVAAVPVFASETTTAAEDPLTVIKNLDEFIFGIIRFIGIGFAGFGIFQIGSSLPSHDATQRAIGISSCVGGLIMIFSKQILVAIGAY